MRTLRSRLLAFLPVVVLALALLPPSAAGQTKRPARPAGAAAKSSATQPKFKAIWEPVNYKQDLNLTDVYFVSALEGWVAGEHGTILHTKDGGDTWTAQVGGDPQSADDPIEHLRFVDATHGWAKSGRSKLLRTTDGESWGEVGKLGGNYGFAQYYLFTTATTGLQIRDQPFDIAQTNDAGKTWKPVMPECTAKMEVEGLTKQVECKLKSLHFPTANVGYAVGTGAKALFVLRTDDGGATWKTSVTPDVASGDSTYFRQEVFFTSESVGFVAMNDHKILMTSDGGQTWHGVIGATHGKIQFADPEVGWSFDDRKMVYSVNGGKSWTARELRLPAEMTAFSYPARQRGYVVGQHGMIYRYRVVPFDYTAKGMIDAPMMPAAGSQ